MDDFKNNIRLSNAPTKPVPLIEKLNMRQRFTVPINFRPNRSGISKATTIVCLIILLIAGIGVYSALNSQDTGPSFAPITSKVTQGDFVSKVLDQGEIESSDNVEIRCEVKARNGGVSVLKAATEGIQVKPGDFLVQLDSASFDKELETQNIAIASAKTKVIKAETTLETARATKREYEEGVFVEALQTFENDIFDAQSQISTAKQEMEQSIAVMEHSEKLHSRGFITQRQLNADEFAVEKAKIAIKKAENLLSLANQKKKVLVEVTQEKELTQLDAEIRAAKVDLDSQQQSFAVEEQKLADINEAIAKCRIVAPPGVEGQLVYAKESRGRGGDDWVLEEGASVRENQVLVRVPDPKKMQVKALINEQSITQIEPNMPAIVQVDALNDISLQGIVVKVNQYAESKGWFGSNVRKYAVFIRILDPPMSLKPGMNASVSIQSRFQKDTMLAPLQTVYSVQGRSFCLIKSGDNYETKEVVIGGDNSKMVMFQDGVSVGDELVMNPGSFKDQMELPEVLADESIELPDNVTLVKTDAKAQGGKPSGGPGGGGRPGGGGGGGGDRTSGMVNGMMSKYDTNSDGTIDATEMASLEGRAKTFVAGADADSDGTVTKAELTKTAKKMMAKWGGGGGGGPGGGGGRPEVSAEGSSGSQP